MDPGKSGGNVVKKVIDEKLIIVAYIAMLILCIFLNSSGAQEDEYSLIINIVMFAIVGMVFGWAVIKPFRSIKELSKELKEAAVKIRNDHESEIGYLWDKYKDDDESGLFKQGIITETYHDYLAEMKRLEESSSSGFQCSIENYINQEYIDKIVEKNLLSIIPGSMTGMGILGTFIGLSFGLKSFNTEDIENSITPLMNGIKVAFHTSIFGMVFSLVFNLVYKNILEQAYQNMDEFINAYLLYVLPDTENEGFSKLIESQQKQSGAITNPILSAIQSMNDNLERVLEIHQDQSDSLKRLPEEIGESIGRKLGDIIVPLFMQTNENLKTFADELGDKQVSQVGDLVDRFVSQMNESMLDSFTNLGKVIEDTCSLQKLSSNYMQEILSRVGQMTLQIDQINEVSSKTIQSLSDYVQDLENLQSIINKSFMSVNLQLDQNIKQEEKQQSYIRSLVEYERQIGEASEKFNHDMAEQIELLKHFEQEMSSSAKENLENLSNAANEYSKQLADTSNYQLQKMVDITSHFKENLVKQIDEMTKWAVIQNNAIADAARKEIQKIVTLSSTATGDMDRAAQTLGNASKQLTGQLQQSVYKTFDIFDKELSDITKHLSGTIAEVDNTTKRVPKVVESAYEDMGKAFEEMEKQMQSMVHMLDIMQRNMPSVVDELLRDKPQR